MASLSKLVASKRWKKMMSFMYGWGAALVIIGALFKLQHWNGAGYMLSIGMITECIIFFFSAFEPLPADYHWESVYPQLAGGAPIAPGHGNAPAGMPHGAVGRGGVDLAIDPDSAENLRRNVDRFNQSVSSLGALATITDASNRFASGLQQAAGNIGALNDTAQTFTAAYRDTAQTVVTGGQQANANLAALNNNLQAVNTSYELYLKEHQGYVEHSRNLLGAMDNSAKQSQQFDRQMLELNRLIAELNTTYTSVVNTVNATLKKR